MGTPLPGLWHPGAAVEGRRVTRPRDLPVGGRRPRLVWAKRRWRCDEPTCRRRSFTESVPAVPPRKRLTTRLRAAAGAAVADQGRTVVQAARDHALSWPVVAAAFAGVGVNVHSQVQLNVHSVVQMAEARPSLQPAASRPADSARPTGTGGRPS
ncbi:helix-turn-helix domain-containing protein [Micromonospora sp. NPDC006431]|uniref:helix-turn-helix domain-containing protein n=1 Tax=Micromonospora sp. NPDC006431 TaxID=3364235 RepID=UPI0036B5B325